MHDFGRWEEAGVPGDGVEHANSTQKGPSRELNLEPTHCGAQGANYGGARGVSAPLNET